MKQDERERVEDILVAALKKQRKPVSALELYEAAESTRKITATRSEMHRALWRLASKRAVTFNRDWKVEVPSTLNDRSRPRSGGRGVQRTTR